MISDDPRLLATRLAELLASERSALGDFLLALADFDRQRGWLALGYPSLWTFLRQKLHLSKSAAFQRKTAAELVQSFPAVADALRSGELCLSTVAQLARVLSPENQAAVLPRFFGLSHREAEALSASLLPAKFIPTRDVVRLLSASPPGRPALATTQQLETQANGRGSAPAGDQANGPVGHPTSGQVNALDGSMNDRAGEPGELVINPASGSGDTLASGQASLSASPTGDRVGGRAYPPATRELGEPPHVLAPSPKGVVLTSELRASISAPPRPTSAMTTAFLDADRARISVTVPRRILDKLEAARDALAHLVPDGNLADVLEHALDLVLEESRKKRSLVAKPRESARPANESSRHVPAQVARAVWQRAEGRCECTLPDGSRCESTRALELDHLQPFALGGLSTIENLRVACRDCNQLAARKAFGDAVMDRYSRQERRGAAHPGGVDRADRSPARSQGALPWSG